MLNQTQSSRHVTPQGAASRCYVCNPHPCYHPPKADVNPPRIIKAMRKAARENTPSWSAVWRTEYRFQGVPPQPIIEQRSINLHRRRAIDAMAECMAAHVNVVTCKVYASLSQLSDWCGLTTYSEKGVPSYSRASRAMTEHFEAIGAVTCEREWDQTTRSYLPNLIWVNELFFALIGFEYGKFQSAQHQQLAWENQGLKEKGAEPISLTEARRRAKEKHRAAAWAARAKKLESHKIEKRAKKLAAMDEHAAKAQIQIELLKRYTKEELAAMGHVEFARRVNERYYTMKKIASSSSPPQPPPDRG